MIFPIRLLATLIIALLPASLQAADDFGQRQEKRVSRESRALFGVGRPLDASAPRSARPYRNADQPAAAQLDLASGLRARYLTRTAPALTDMLVLYPPGQPTHLIASVETSRAQAVASGPGEHNPSLTAISLADGSARILVRGLHAADGLRVTPWGTVLVTEETNDGAAWEISDPLTLSEATVLDRAEGTSTAPDQLHRRSALPVMAWEGLAIHASGVVYAGDELRPGEAGADRDGGAITKFIPAAPRLPAALSSSQNDSPLSEGRVYALQVLSRPAKHDPTQQGQGAEIGLGRWVEVDAAHARDSAAAAHATGYFRPEDLHFDPGYRDLGRPESVRFCWSNTGDVTAGHHGEVLCAVDDAPLSPESGVTVTRFIEGDPEFNSFDNLDFQPGTGNLYVLEDHPNGDILACLPDGADRDQKSDGCARVLSVRDSSAEPTGLLFDPSGRTAWLAIQHSDDGAMADGAATDDIIEISGFRKPRRCPLRRLFD